MRGALVILIAMVVIGIILFVTDVVYYRHKKDMAEEASPTDTPKKENRDPEREMGKTSSEDVADHGDFCCGKHLVCEKKEMQTCTDIIYYDDEELDRFKGRTSSSYTEAETEEFRDILLTLLPSDVEGWARSIQLREIELPEEVRDELILILREV